MMLPARILLGGLLLCSVCPATHVAAVTPLSAEVKGRLSVARNLGHATKWADAVTVLEPLVSAAPEDPELLNELAWATFQQGDVLKARGVAERAVKAARERKAQASALYNLGRIEEAQGRRDLAGKHYDASYALVPSKVVESRLFLLVDREAARLPVEAAAEGGMCPSGGDLPALCECAARVATIDTDRLRIRCKWQDDALPVPGARLLSLEAEYGIQITLLLLEHRPDGWAVAGRLDDGIVTSREPTESRLELVGDRQILRITTNVVAYRNGGGSYYEEHLRIETVCFASAPGDPLRCPLRARVFDEYHFKPSEPTDEQWNWRQRLRVDVGQDGLAQVVLLEGRASHQAALGEAALGLHRLW